MINRSTHLIANCIYVDEIDILPYEFENGAIFRRPNDCELDCFRRTLSSRTGSPDKTRLLYETTFLSDHGNLSNIKYQDNPSAYHYYVFSDNDWGNSVREFEEPLSLLDPQLEFAMQFSCHFENSDAPATHIGYTLPTPSIIERYYYDGFYPKERTKISIQLLLEAEKIIRDLKDISDEFTFIKNSMATWKEVIKLSRRTKFQVVALFSIIEMLLTHSPRLVESLDSINHQLRGKLKLIMNHTGCQNLLAQYFGVAMPMETIWKKLYAYRSDIAHGNLINFTKDYLILKSHENVVDFLMIITRTLIRNSIKNPQLFSDLKAC